MEDVSGRCDRAVSIVDRVVSGDLAVAVDAYVFNEVVDGIARSGIDYSVIDEAQTRFAEIVHGCPAIHPPSQQDVQTLHLEDVRSNPRVQLLGATWDVQPKDVPIIELAYQQPSEPTIVFTSDQELSQFDPHEHGVEGVALRYVDCR